MFLNFLCNPFECKSDMHFCTSLKNLTGQTTWKPSAVIRESCSLFAATVKKINKFFLKRFLHLTTTSHNQVNNMNPCQMKKTESEGKNCPCICLCVYQPHCGVIDPCRPFAHKLSRHSRNFCSCLSMWPLIFLSGAARNPQWHRTHRQGSNAMSRWSRHLTHPAGSPMLAKMQESITHFHPMAACEPDINPLLNWSPKCWHPPAGSIVSLPDKFKKCLMGKHHEVQIR